MARAVIGINDSRLGSVARDDTDAGCRLTLDGIGELIVPSTHPTATVRVGDRDVDLSRRRWLLLPHTFAVRTRHDGIGYRLLPRGLRLAELMRERTMLAVLARPHRGERIVRWDERVGPADTEIAIGHAMAVYAGF